MGLFNWLANKAYSVVANKAYGTTPQAQDQYDSAEEKEGAVLADGTTITYVNARVGWQIKKPDGTVTFSKTCPPF